ncbi:MAG: GNAT family N-acetyltransferase [Chitinophagales bacterium]
MPIIRPAQESDLPQILTIYNDIILNTTAVYDYRPHTIEMRREWFSGKRSGNFPVFVAELSSHIIGFSSIGPFRTWAAYKYTVENSIYVAADCRGRGVGKLLLEPLIKEAKAKELHAMIASIDATNKPSLCLHKSFGFVEVAHFLQVGYKFEKWLDLKFLELIFDGPAHPVED